MTTFASSQFGVVLLCTMSIGLLMLMAPQFGTALECYATHNPWSTNWPLRGDRRGAAASWHQLLGMPTADSNANGGGNQTIQCDTFMTYCFTEYCRNRSKKTQKGCAWIAPGYTPEDMCKMDQQMCGDGFYCRYCQGDKCNDEPLDYDNDNNAIAIGMQ